MAKNLYRVRIAPSLASHLRVMLEEQGFEVQPVEHALWQAKKNRIFVTFFRDGGIIIRGKNANHIGEKLVAELSDLKIEERSPEEDWVMTHQYGENKFWGPLVSSAIIDDEKTEKMLARIHLRDDQTYSVQEIMDLAKLIRKYCQHSISTISPFEYNRLFEKYLDQKKVMAISTADVIRNVHSKEERTAFIVSDLVDDVFLKDTVSDVPDLTVITRDRSEKGLAIFAAYILAKSKYFEFMNTLEKKYFSALPTTVSKLDVKFVDNFISQHGKKALKRVAKLCLSEHPTI